MKVKSPDEVDGEAVVTEDAQGVTRWVLVSREDKAPNFAMRRFRLEPGGHTPYHHHPFEHEVFVLGGRGTLRGEESELELLPGSSVYVPPDEMHQFRASAETTLEFLCMVPHSGQEPVKGKSDRASGGESDPGCQG